MYRRRLGLFCGDWNPALRFESAYSPSLEATNLEEDLPGTAGILPAVAEASRSRQEFRHFEM